MPTARSYLRLIHLALLTGACSYDPLTDAEGSSTSQTGSKSDEEDFSSGDDIGPPTVVENGCAVDADSRFLVRLKNGASCDELGLDEFGPVQLEAGFCATKLPSSLDAWPVEIAAAEPLCDTVRAQGTFECAPDLPETYMAGIGGQFHRAAWSEVSHAKFTGSVSVAILDTAEDLSSACQEPGSHACSVEQAFLGGAGADWGQPALHVAIRHYGALGQSDGTGTVEQLHAALANAIEDNHKVMLLALGWNGNPGEVGVELIRVMLARARDAGVLVVAAAGNMDEPRCGEPKMGMLYPAAYAVDEPDPAALNRPPLVLPVGALGDDGHVLSTALPGGVPPLVAPGNLIWMNTEGSCRFGSGSSIAAGYAAGVAALALASAGPLELCLLHRALYAGAPMQSADPSLVVCGNSKIADMHALHARATLADLKIAVAEEPSHAAADQLLWGTEVLAAVRSAPRNFNTDPNCTGNYWGPPKVDNIEFVHQCPSDGEPRPGGGAAGPTPSIKISPETIVKSCLSCAVFTPDDPSVLQVVLKPDFTALWDEIKGDEEEEVTAWLVLEWSAEPGISTFNVSSTPVITIKHTQSGGVWQTVGGWGLQSRAVVLAPVPDGVAAKEIRAWLRYDYATGRPSRWESLGYPIQGVPGLADDEFLTGYCEGPTWPPPPTCVGGCREPGVKKMVKF